VATPGSPLPERAVVGTASPRRRAFLLAARPDRIVDPVRGNVDTRLRKLEAARLDPVILAVQARRDDDRTLRWLESLDHAPTRMAALAERAEALGRDVAETLLQRGAASITPLRPERSLR
jgi:hydroxymethylbilane synthase